jgi:RNA polymerase sigma factor for flagellar operon FliA
MAKKETPIDKVWKKYLKTREVALRNELIVHYRDLVHTHAARLSRKLPAQVSYDEICSAAFDGLMEAVEAFDPARKAKFETFCQQRISGAVMDWLRSLDPQSRTVRTFEKRRLAVQEMLDAERGRPPTHAEIAQRMGISLGRYNHLCRLSQLGREVHFSAMEPTQERTTGNAARQWDLGDSRQLDPSTNISRKTVSEYITRGLSRDERLVLILYYYEELTMAEIGAVLNLSESRVSQIHKDILQRLRQRFGHTLQEELVA